LPGGWGVAPRGGVDSLYDFLDVSPSAIGGINAGEMSIVMESPQPGDRAARRAAPLVAGGHREEG
jgi:hypothetical protein